MKLANYPLSRRDKIVIQEMDDELLIYDLAKNKAYCLNQTLAIIWQECDGENSVTQISLNLSKKLKVNVNEDLVWLALKQLKNESLLEKSVEIKTPFDGLNRREIVKRIGFASMVALPILSSVLAPSAISAQSAGCGCSTPSGSLARSPGCNCVMNSDCCSNVCSGGIICAVSGGNAPGSASCCQPVVCGSANTNGLAPGCLCVGNGNCASGNCVSPQSICGF